MDENQFFETPYCALNFYLSIQYYSTFYVSIFIPLFFMSLCLYACILPLQLIITYETNVSRAQDTEHRQHTSSLVEARHVLHFPSS